VKYPWFPLIIVLVCFLLYGNTLRNDYTLDDGIYTNQNDFILKGFSAFKDIFDKGSLYGNDKTRDMQYRPLTLLSFMAEVSVFGFNPHISHFFNVLLFAFTAVLLYYFLKKILQRFDPITPVAATLLFIFHPIHTEVVASIKSRDEILGLLFGLATFYFILLYQEQKKKRYYLFSLGTFLIAIFCKENCLSFAVIIPLLLYFFSSLEIKKISFQAIPYLGLAVFYLLIRFLVMRTLTFSHPIQLMSNALMSTSSHADRMATSMLLMGKYIYMTVVPYPLCWDYSYNQIPVVSWGDGAVLLSVLGCAGLAVVVIAGFRKKSICSFSILFFFITLFLSSNLVVKIAWTFAERFLYVPSLGFCIIFPVLVMQAVNKKFFYGAMICLLIIYTGIVLPRNSEWKNNLSLFTSGIVVSPNSARAHLTLAGEYGTQLKKAATTEEKRRLFNLDLEESNRALAIFSNYYEAYNNLGTLYLAFGMNERAKNAFQRALALSPMNTEAANDLGAIYAGKSEYPAAIRFLKIAMNADSAFPDPFTNLGATYQKMDRMDSAVFYYKKGLKLNPGSKEIVDNLFLLYFNSGKRYFNNKEYARALEQFLLANQYNANSDEVNGYLGALSQSRGDFPGAIEYYTRSLEINPTNESVRMNLEICRKAKR